MDGAKSKVVFLAFRLGKVTKQIYTAVDLLALTPVSIPLHRGITEQTIAHS